MQRNPFNTAIHDKETKENVYSVLVQEKKYRLSSSEDVHLSRLLSHQWKLPKKHAKGQFIKVTTIHRTYFSQWHYHIPIHCQHKISRVKSFVLPKAILLSDPKLYAALWEKREQTPTAWLILMINLISNLPHSHNSSATTRCFIGKSPIKYGLAHTYN